MNDHEAAWFESGLKAGIKEGRAQMKGELLADRDRLAAQHADLVAALCGVQETADAGWDRADHEHRLGNSRENDIRNIFQSIGTQTRAALASEKGGS